MTTVIYAFIFSLIAFIYPMKTWKAIVLISVGGVLGMLEQTVAFKPWVLWTVQFWFGLIGFKILHQKRALDPFKFRYATLLLITGFWLYLYGLVVDFTFIPFWTSFQGGFMALFILAHLHNKSIWKGITVIIGIHLFLSAIVYYLMLYFPALSILDGVHYNEQSKEFQSYTGEFARGIINEGMGVRGGGVYFNSNAWAQVSGWGTIVGSAIFLVGDKKRMRIMGLLLLAMGILGLLGSASRSSIFAALISVPLLYLTHLIKRNPLFRIMILLGVVVAGYFLIKYAIGLSKVSDLEIISTEGSKYRIMNFYLVWENFGKFLIAGRQGQGHPFDPHDILANSYYNFGLLGLIVAVMCIIGGIIIVWQWSVKGERAIRPYLGMPVEYEAIASLAIAPLFIFYLVSSLGNGVAGGLPYTNIFLLFGYIGWNIKSGRRVPVNGYRLPLQRKTYMHPLNQGSTG